jgi:hypothetical protein
MVSKRSGTVAAEAAREKLMARAEISGRIKKL